MTAMGFVLVSTVPGKENEINEKLRAADFVVETHLLFGEFDIIAKIKAKDFDELSKLIVDRIRKTEGIVDTKTLTGAVFNE